MIPNKTRLTTFIKTKFKISRDQTNIDKYRLAQNITEYHIISKLILQRIIITKFCGSVSDLESPSNFQVKEEEKYSNRSINNKSMLRLKLPES